VPIYEYQCGKCGHIFERDHAVGEKKQYRCPECSCKNTKKIVSSVGVIFKGSGFYATDSRKNNGDTKRSGNDNKPEAKTETTSPVSEN
jgi:putative FmdB family regulatory protein